MRPLKLILSCVILVAITSCSGSKKTTAKHYIKKPRTQQTQTKPLVENETDVPAVELPTTMTSEQRVSYYINTFQALAQEEMERYGIPASITLAQGILESGAGNGALALKAQNHFGIKCHSTWSGDRVYHDDDEKGECFRKYTDAKYSYRDHSLFLTQRSRYSDLFDLDQDDYKSWARGLKKAGYATDPKYPDKLINLIERFELWRYDDQVLGKNSKRAMPKKVLPVYVVQVGDTLYSIAKQFGLTVDQLIEWNDLKGSLISIDQELYVTKGDQ